MAITEQQIATYAMHRLKTDGRMELPLQSFIGNALNNLARKIAVDQTRRQYLMTDSKSVTASNSNVDGLASYADLTSLLADPQIMLDMLSYGNIFWAPTPITWTALAVSGNTIAINSLGFWQGQAVTLSTTGALPAPLAPGTTYYLVTTGGDTTPISVSFAATAADAAAGNVITLTNSGSGIGTMTLKSTIVCQWLGGMEQGLLPQCLPFQYATIWLQGSFLYTLRSGGTFSFAVPFIPTLDDLPEALESDLLDEVVNIALTSGFEGKE